MNLHLRFKLFTFIAISFLGSGIPYVAFCQNQYIQNWDFHTDSTNDYIASELLHLNELAQSLIVMSTQSDSIDIYKTDSSGTLMWRKKFHVAPFENRVTATKIASDHDFNYYLTIRGNQSATQLVKLDSAGNIMLNVPDTLNDYLFTFPAVANPISSLVAYDANSLYVIKRYYYNSPEVYFITKYDHQFNAIWTRKLSSAYNSSPFHFSLDSNGIINTMVDTFNLSVDTTYGFRLSFDSNGDTVIYHNLWNHKYMNSHWSSTIDGTGKALLTLRYDTATWTSTPPSIVIARFDTIGVIMWSDTIWSSLTLGEDPSGLYGDTWGNAYLLSYQTFSQSNILSKRRIYLRKYDPNGQQIWFRSWEGNDSTTFLFRPPYLRYFDENNIFVTGTIVNSGSFYDALIAKTDSAGNYIWQSNYSVNNDLGETFNVLERDLCNNLYVLGLTDSLTAAGRFLHLVRYITETPCFTSENDVGSKSTLFSIYPNPATDFISFTPNNIFAVEKLFIYDVTGRLVFEKNMNETSNIDISYFTPALYFYEVRSTEGEIVYGKFLKQ